MKTTPAQCARATAAAASLAIALGELILVAKAADEKALEKMVGLLKALEL